MSVEGADGSARVQVQRSRMHIEEQEQDVSDQCQWGQLQPTLATQGSANLVLGINNIFTAARGVLEQKRQLKKETYACAVVLQNRLITQFAGPLDLDRAQVRLKTVALTAAAAVADTLAHNTPCQPCPCAPVASQTQMQPNGPCTHSPSHTRLAPHHSMLCTCSSTQAQK